MALSRGYKWDHIVQITTDKDVVFVGMSGDDALALRGSGMMVWQHSGFYNYASLFPIYGTRQWRNDKLIYVVDLGRNGFDGE